LRRRKARNGKTSVTLRERSEVAGSIFSVILHEVAGSIGVGGLWMPGFCDYAQNDGVAQENGVCFLLSTVTLRKRSEIAGSIGFGGFWMHGFCDCAQNDGGGMQNDGGGAHGVMRKNMVCPLFARKHGIQGA